MMTEDARVEAALTALFRSDEEHREQMAVGYFTAKSRMASVIAAVDAVTSVVSVDADGTVRNWKGDAVGVAVPGEGGE